MEIGDLVWSVHLDSFMQDTVVERQLAIIIDIEPRGNNCYIIALVVSGRQGRTSEKYLRKMETK